MNAIRIALANLRAPVTPDESVDLAVNAVADAAGEGARVVCFPECYVPGYRVGVRPLRPIDPAFLERAWARVAAAAKASRITVVLGTERLDGAARRLAVLVVNDDGTSAGFQDKVQLDPSEEALYAPASGRRLFQAGPLTFGVVICHEGWRYPETVRWAARRGAQLVFHPHYDEDPPQPYKAGFADPSNTFHEKAMLCRAAENTCYFASVNCAGAGSATTSAIARPDGTLLAWQPYGEEGLLVVDLDLDQATGLLARRCREPYGSA